MRPVCKHKEPYLARSHKSSFVSSVCYWTFERLNPNGYRYFPSWTCHGFLGEKVLLRDHRILASMRRIVTSKPTFFHILILFASAFLHAPFACAWGNEGHRIINRLAISNLPPECPSFLRSPGAAEEIEYLGPEPDRWRSPAEPELNAAQAPEHYLNLELADGLGPLPRRRFDFEAAALAAGQRPEKIGLQPWEAPEIWERLKAALREYRRLAAAHANTHHVEQTAIFYAGWLGHYVGDAAQPLHTTVQYNGWTGPNPNGYTTTNTIHWQFEGTFVAANLHAADVQPHLTETHPLEGDVFADYLAYLRRSSTYVEQVYQLEKAGGFQGQGTAESRAFTAERLAAGASKLRDMIYSAWIQSGNPVPAPAPTQ